MQNAGPSATVDSTKPNLCRQAEPSSHPKEWCAAYSNDLLHLLAAKLQGVSVALMGINMAAKCRPS